MRSVRFEYIYIYIYTHTHTHTFIRIFKAREGNSSVRVAVPGASRCENAATLMSAEAASTLRKRHGPLRVETMAVRRLAREPAETYGARRQLGLFTIAGHERVRTDGRIPFGLHSPTLHSAFYLHRTNAVSRTKCLVRARARMRFYFHRND